MDRNGVGGGKLEFEKLKFFHSGADIPPNLVSVGRNMGAIGWKWDFIGVQPEALQMMSEIRLKMS